MFNMTEEQVMDIIDLEKRNNNLLLTDVPTDTLERVRNKLLEPGMREKGYILVELELMEVLDIEEMIENVEIAFNLATSNGIQDQLNVIQEGIIRMNQLIKKILL